MPKKNPEFLTMKPAEGTCDVHGWPTTGMPKRLLEAIKSTDGVNACRDCIARVKAEADRERAARCVLCHQGVGRGVGNRGHGMRTAIGMLDVTCPITQEQLDKLMNELKDAVGEMFPKEGKST